MSEEEFHWLTMRAKGGYALTMTCASHVHALGKGFSGQLGCFDETHLEGLTRLAAEIRKHESVSVVQLHHRAWCAGWAVRHKRWMMWPGSWRYRLAPVRFVLLT